MSNILLKIKKLFKEIMFFTTSYSLNVFDEPLSEEEENYYVEKLLNEKDKTARNKLIEHNLRLVAHIVKKYDNMGTNNDDLISIGTIGLIKGIDSYKKEKEVKLTTYAAKCAENEILMHFRSNKKHSNNMSLNEIIGYDKDGSEISLIDVLKEQTSGMENKVELNENIRSLNKYLRILNEREFEIIKMRYGLYNTDEFTQIEIAKKLKISRSYVSRIEKRALIKMLREFVKNNEI